MEKKLLGPQKRMEKRMEMRECPGILERELREEVKKTHTGDIVVFCPNGYDPRDEGQRRVGRKGENLDANSEEKKKTSNQEEKKRSEEEEKRRNEPRPSAYFYVSFTKRFAEMDLPAFLSKWVDSEESKNHVIGDEVGDSIIAYQYARAHFKSAISHAITLAENIEDVPQKEFYRENDVREKYLWGLPRTRIYERDPFPIIGERREDAKGDSRSSHSKSQGVGGGGGGGSMSKVGGESKDVLIEGPLEFGPRAESPSSSGTLGKNRKKKKKKKGKGISEVPKTILVKEEEFYCRMEEKRGLNVDFVERGPPGYRRLMRFDDEIPYSKKDAYEDSEENVGSEEEEECAHMKDNGGGVGMVEESLIRKKRKKGGPETYQRKLFHYSLENRDHEKGGLSTTPSSPRARARSSSPGVSRTLASDVSKPILEERSSLVTEAEVADSPKKERTNSILSNGSNKPLSSLSNPSEKLSPDKEIVTTTTTIAAAVAVPSSGASPLAVPVREGERDTYQGEKERSASPIDPTGEEGVGGTVNAEKDMHGCDSDLLSPSLLKFSDNEEKGGIVGEDGTLKVTRLPSPSFVGVYDKKSKRAPKGKGTDLGPSAGSGPSSDAPEDCEMGGRKVRDADNDEEEEEEEETDGAKRETPSSVYKRRPFARKTAKRKPITKGGYDAQIEENSSRKTLYYALVCSMMLDRSYYEKRMRYETSSKKKRRAIFDSKNNRASNSDRNYYDDDVFCSFCSLCDCGETDDRENVRGSPKIRAEGSDALYVTETDKGDDGLQISKKSISDMMTGYGAENIVFFDGDEGHSPNVMIERRGSEENIERKRRHMLSEGERKKSDFDFDMGIYGYMREDETMEETRARKGVNSTLNILGCISVCHELEATYTDIGGCGSSSGGIRSGTGADRCPHHSSCNRRGANFRTVAFGERHEGTEERRSIKSSASPKYPTTAGSLPSSSTTTPRDLKISLSPKRKTEDVHGNRTRRNSEKGAGNKGERGRKGATWDVKREDKEGETFVKGELEGSTTVVKSKSLDGVFETSSNVKASRKTQGANRGPKEATGTRDNAEDGGFRSVKGSNAVSKTFSGLISSMSSANATDNNNSGKTSATTATTTASTTAFSTSTVTGVSKGKCQPLSVGVSFDLRNYEFAVDDDERDAIILSRENKPFICTITRKNVPLGEVYRYVCDILDMAAIRKEKGIENSLNIDCIIRDPSSSLGTRLRLGKAAPHRF